MKKKFDIYQKGAKAAILSLFFISIPPLFNLVNNADGYPLKLPYTREFFFNYSVPSDILSPSEEKFSKKISQLFKKNGQPPPLWDWNLKQISEILALRALRVKSRYLPQSALDAARWLAGDTARQFYIFLGLFSNAKELKFRFSRYLKKQLIFAGINRFALTVWPIKDKKFIFSSTFVRRGIVLSPIPKAIFLGEPLIIRGKLLKTLHNPFLILAEKKGKKIFKYPINTDNYGQFKLYIPSKIFRSKHLLCQFSVSDRARGPWISDYFNIFIGKSIREIKNFLKKKREKLKNLLRTDIKPPPIWKKKASLAAAILWKIVQNYRKKYHLALLKRDPELDNIATEYAKEMARNNFFAHRSPISGSLRDRISQYPRHFSFASENIAVAENPLAAFESFIKSPIHRANILNPKFKISGLGAAKNRKGELFFVQIFLQ